MERINTAAARAINALPPEEAAEFDEMVEGDVYLLAHVDSFRRVAIELTDGLPEIVPVASPVIWERIVKETGIGRDREPSPAPVAPSQRRSRGILMAVAAVAAALVFGVAAGGVSNGSTPSMREAAAAAASKPDATTIAMASPSGIAAINASVVLTGDGTGYLTAESLPALTEDRTYQLWVVVDDQVISAGLLGNDPNVVQFRAEGNIVGMAISNETVGGVVVSENDPVALWLRDA
jgi:hypothetical protein